jgi:hypothetical protein
MHFVCLHPLIANVCEVSTCHRAREVVRGKGGGYYGGQGLALFLDPFLWPINHV